MTAPAAPPASAIAEEALLRADGPPARNRYWWPLEGDAFRLRHRGYSGRWHLAVVPLNNGRWLAEPPGCFSYSPQFPSRESAIRTAAARLLRRIRRRDNRSLSPMSQGEADFASAWLFGVLVRQLGRRRRWRWRRALHRLCYAHGVVRWHIDLELHSARDRARQVAGPEPRSGKRARAEWEARHAEAFSAAVARREARLRALRRRLRALKRRIARVEALRR